MADFIYPPLPPDTDDVHYEHEGKFSLRGEVFVPVFEKPHTFPIAVLYEED